MQPVSQYLKTGIDCVFLIFSGLILRVCIRNIFSKVTKIEVQQSRYVAVSLTAEEKIYVAFQDRRKLECSRTEISKTIV
jgi:hypothetical protein